VDVEDITIVLTERKFEHSSFFYDKETEK